LLYKIEAEQAPIHEGLPWRTFFATCAKKWKIVGSHLQKIYVAHMMHTLLAEAREKKKKEDYQVCDA